MTRILRILGAFLFVVIAVPAWADSVAEFYRGKQIHLIVGYPAGTGYDVHARALAAHLARHIPGEPTILTENMAGAGSLLAANNLYNKAPRDGTYIGALNHDMLVAPLLEVSEGNIQFDPRKFVWLGSINSAVSIGFVMASSGITRFEQVLARPVIVGASPGGSESFMISNMLNKLLGTKLKIVAGYPGSTDILLAMERGEVEGYFGSTFSTLVTTRPDWLAEKKVNVLVQVSLAGDPALENVPLVTTLAKSDEQREALALILAPEQASRPFMAPPGLPADRAKALQAAFDATMKDPAFLADAAKAKIDVSPMRGSEISAMLQRIYATPPPIVEAARRAIAVEK